MACRPYDPNSISRPMAFGNAWSFTTELLARTWPHVVAALLAGGAIVGLGCWLARYVGIVSDGGSVPRTQRSASP